MDKLEISTILPVKAAMVYTDWTTSKRHTEMTGGEAIIHNEVGSKYSAWDGYIFGKIEELVENKLIQMSWRTADFAEEAQNSQLQVMLEDINNGCKITLKHWNIPDGDGEKYKDGWQEHYFEPMLQYYTED
jgi:activator of HSP90 ATPase